MPASHVLATHDDGRLYVAELLDPYRDRQDHSWRLVVRYPVEPSLTYVRAMPATAAVRSPRQGLTQPNHAQP